MWDGLGQRSHSAGFRDTAWGFNQSGFGEGLSAEAVGDYQVTKYVMIAR